MKFKELRRFVSKVDSISIMLLSIGDVDDNYLNIEHVPDKYDEYEVIGFGCADCLDVDGYDFLQKGVEFYLDDVQHDENSHRRSPMRRLQ